ncbi:hypothetical protein chiPu_0020255, partial [Chiloscyllium punctatum]|nr:hypothetical protein [Chiloscyllium punctatum]
LEIVIKLDTRADSVRRLTTGRLLLLLYPGLSQGLPSDGGLRTIV